MKNAPYFTLGDMPARDTNSRKRLTGTPYVDWQRRDSALPTPNRSLGLFSRPIEPRASSSQELKNPSLQALGICQPCEAVRPLLLVPWQRDDPVGSRGGGIDPAVSQDNPLCGTHLDNCRNPASRPLTSLDTTTRETSRALRRLTLLRYDLVDSFLLDRRPGLHAPG